MRNEQNRMIMDKLLKSKKPNDIASTVFCFFMRLKRKGEKAPLDIIKNNGDTYDE